MGIKGQDKYTITWNAVENAKEYLICVYDGGKKISDAVVTGTPMIISITMKPLERHWDSP